jgi:hypothetical protein
LYFFSGPALTVPPMYVEFDIPHIYLLSNIFIVLKPTLEALKLHCGVLVWRDFLIFLIIHISESPAGISVRLVEFALDIIYLPKSNEEYFNGSSSHGAIVRMHDERHS